MIDKVTTDYQTNLNNNQIQIIIWTYRVFNIANL